MGSGSSKAVFRDVISELAEGDISLNEKDFWKKLWTTEATPHVSSADFTRDARLIVATSVPSYSVVGGILPRHCDCVNAEAMSLVLFHMRNLLKMSMDLLSLVCPHSVLVTRTGIPLVTAEC